MTTQNIEVGSFPLPLGNYQVRCIGCTFEMSSKGNPMYKQQWEIVTPTVNYKGKVWQCAGLQFTNWTTLTDKAKKNNEEFLKKLDISASLDANNPTPDAFLGIGARCFLVGQEKKWEVEEEAADGTKVKRVLTDADGSPAVTYDVQIHRALGFRGRDKTVDAPVAY